jgi:hypothetical protein
MGRICGAGPITIDSSNLFNNLHIPLTSVSSGTGGVIKVTHSASLGGTTDFFLDGDQVEVEGLSSSGAGAAAANGVWNIVKLSATQVELIGSTFVADTYTYTNATIKPGPRFHLRDILSEGAPGIRPTYAIAPASSGRYTCMSRTKNFELLWLDSGSTFDNLGATGEVVFTLPRINWPAGVETRGARYNFIVLTAQPIKIQVSSEATGGTTSRIFRAGGYATAGTNVSSNVIGNSLELILADNTGSGEIGYRWLIRLETGTWTIAGTP